MSIDPGFRRLGWTQWSGVEVESSNLREYRERGKTEKFAAYRTEGVEDFTDFFLSVVEGNEFVVFETMPLNNITTQRVLTSMIVGVILSSNHMLDVKSHEISAIEVKNRVTGNPKASKAVVRRAVFEAFPDLRQGRKLGDICFDETDSTAIGMAWIDKIGTLS